MTTRKLIDVLKTFQDAGVDRTLLISSICQMCPDAIRTTKARKAWSPINPLYFTCYFVSEWYFYYKAPKGTVPYSVKVPGDDGLHRFVKHPDGIIIDLTAEQFYNFEDVDYSKARVRPFMTTGKGQNGGPSKRARKLQELMGGDPDKWNDPRYPDPPKEKRYKGPIVAHSVEELRAKIKEAKR